MCQKNTPYDMYVYSVSSRRRNRLEGPPSCKIALCQNNVSYQLQEYASHAAQKAVFRCKILHFFKFCTTLSEIQRCQYHIAAIFIWQRVNENIFLQVILAAHQDIWKAIHFIKWARSQPSVADWGKCTSHRSRFPTIEHWQHQAGPGGSSCI